MYLPPFFADSGKMFSRILLLVSLGLGIFSLILYLHLVFHPWQHEFREATTANLSALIRSGKNPFQFQAQPQAAYAYGLVFPYLTAALAYFIQDDLLASRLVVAFCHMLLPLFAFALLRRERVPHFWNLSLQVLAFGTSLWFNGFAFPNAPVALFIFLALYVPLRMGFSYPSLFLSAGISLLALGTKQYGILPMPVLAAYLFFRVSYRKALVYSLIQAFLLAAFLWLIYRFFPTWYLNAFFSFRCMAAVYTGESFYMFRQCVEWFRDNLVFLPFLGGGLFALFKTEIPNLFRPGKQAVCPSEPGLEVFLWASFGGLAAFLFRFGYHTGASGGAYLYQLALPFWLIFAGVYGPKWFPVRNLQLLAFFCLALSGQRFASQYVVTMHHLQDNRQVMEALDAAIRPFHRIYASPETASLMLRQGRPVLNSGQTEYFSEVAQCATPFLEQTRTSQGHFDRKLEHACRSRQFDVILRTRDYFGYAVLKPEWLAGYELKKTLFIPMILGGWHMEWWEPLPEPHPEPGFSVPGRSGPAPGQRP